MVALERSRLHTLHGSGFYQVYCSLQLKWQKPTIKLNCNFSYADQLAPISYVMIRSYLTCIFHIHGIPV